MDHLSYEEFFILFLLLQEKNQKKQVQGALYVLLPQSKPPPWAEFFGYFLVQRQESNIALLS